MFRKVLVLPLLLISLFACNSDSNDEKATANALTAKFSNFVGANEKILAFGHMNMFQMLEKSAYKDNSLIKAIIDPLISKMAALDKKSPIYFAVELNEMNIAPVNIEEIINNQEFDAKGYVYAFIAVSNKNEIKKQLEQEGRLRFKSSDGIDYAQENNATIALQNDYLMLMVDLNDNNQVDISQVKDAIKTMENGKSTDIVNKIMTSTTDFMLTYDMGKSVSTLMKGLNISNKESQQLEADLKGCFNTTNINFENGKVILTTENILSPSMSKWRVTKQDTKEIASTLGTGSPTAAIAMNLDIDQIQKIMDNYLKTSLDELQSKLSDNELIEFDRIKKEGISTIFNGRFGIAAFFTSDGYGMIPNVNFQLGVGNMLLEMIKEPLEMAKSNGLTLENKNNILYGYFGPQNTSRTGSLTLPKGAEDFGNYPINGFVDIQKLPVSELGLPDPAMKIISKLSLLKFHVQGDKFTLEIQFKDASQNSLTQIINSVSGLSI